MWKRLYIETFPHFQKKKKKKKKMSKIGVYIIFSIQHCPTVWNTNDDKTLATGQNRFHTFKK